MVLSGGGQLTRRQHLLSRDGRLLLVCNSDRIRVYSALTAELLFSLQGHTDEVTSISLHPKNTSQVYSASKDGTLALWDLQDGTQVQSWPVIGEPIESLAVVGSTAFLTCQWREAKAGRALAFDVSKGAAKEARIKLSKPRDVVVSTGGDLLATHDRHTVLVWSCAAFGTSPPLALRHTKAITCVAISPDGSRVAAGDATGRIVIWHDVATALAARIAAAKASKQLSTSSLTPASVDQANLLTGAEDIAPLEHPDPPAATVHWHAHAVGCLTFSNDGAYLLSGGHEAVLVIWDAASGRRTYLPRLGGPLIGIVPCSADAAKYAIRQNDNTLRVVNIAGMRVECSLHGLRPLPGASSSGAPSAAGIGIGTGAAGTGVPPLALQPGTGLAVLAGPHATLQWYDILRDAHVDKLQLSSRNIVSLTEKDATAMGGVYGPAAEPATVAVAFTRDGSAMATVESRPDPAGGGGVQHALKFWDKDTSGEARYGAPYRLNTLADQPHRSSSGFGAVTSLSLHPTLDLAATTSDTGDFKLWTRQHINHPQNNESQVKRNTATGAATQSASTWRCAAVGSHRSEPLTSSAFSPDGSILALGGATGSVSLWDATQTALLGTLPPALSTSSSSSIGDQSVKQLVFLARSPLLVAVLSRGLAVYNILTLRCEWVAELDVAAVVADSASSHWAVALGGVASKGTTQHAQQARSEHGIVVFKGAEETPIAAWRVSRALGGRGGAAKGTSLAFALPGTPLHSAAAGVGLPGCSPLLVLTGQREYSVAQLKGATSSRMGHAAVAAEGAVGGAVFGRADTFAPSSFEPSAFEALYGKSARRETPGEELASAEGGNGSVGGTRPAWAALFDAPSHALPPIGTLCPAFLELIIAPPE